MTITCPRQPLLSGLKNGHLIQVRMQVQPSKQKQKNKIFILKKLLLAILRRKSSNHWLHDSMHVSNPFAIGNQISNSDDRALKNIECKLIFQIIGTIFFFAGANALVLGHVKLILCLPLTCSFKAIWHICLLCSIFSMFNYFAYSS